MFYGISKPRFWCLSAEPLNISVDQVCSDGHRGQIPAALTVYLQCLCLVCCCCSLSLIYALLRELLLWFSPDPTTLWQTNTSGNVPAIINYVIISVLQTQIVDKPCFPQKVGTLCQHAALQSFGNQGYWPSQFKQGYFSHFFLANLLRRSQSSLLFDRSGVRWFVKQARSV